MVNRLIVADGIRTASGRPGDAVLIKNGVIDTIGRVEDLRGPGVTEELFSGHFITPGLVDAHFHPLGYAAALLRLNVAEARSMTDLGDLIRAAEDGLRPGESLIGTRLDDQAIGRLPTRHDLDGMVDERPVLIYRYCGHVAVANTAALEIAGIASATADPAGGLLDRDDDGRPTGVLRETAIALVAGAVGGRTEGLEPGELLTAMHGLASLGLTSLGAIIDLGGDLWCGVGNELDLLTEIGPDLPLRASVLVTADDPKTLEAAAARLSSAGPLVGFLGVKQFADGSFGGHTAAMNAPFSDLDTRGTLRIDEGTARMARAALAMGGRVAVHAIGDRANSAVLDLFEALIDEGADPTDLRIEHASVLTLPDVGRMSSLGVTAVVQPAFLMSEVEWLEDRLGADRMDRTYAFRSLLEAGVPLAGSSDCPVEPPSPWWGMAAARDRAGLTPAEQLTGAEAFALFTTGAAAAVGSPPLEPGHPADLAIVDRDPVEVTNEQLRSTRVAATLINGERVLVPPDPVVWHAGSAAS